VSATAEARTSLPVEKLFMSAILRLPLSELRENPV
jgi:hypothetical protein